MANDRVKNSDEAIRWIEEKRKAMNRLKDDLTDVQWATHSYRYHANLGTFQIHRWIRNGSFPSDSDDVYSARENIRKVRIEAEEWAEARSSYMESQIGKGIHPDTHAAFWEGFHYKGEPPDFKGDEVR